MKRRLILGLLGALACGTANQHFDRPNPSERVAPPPTSEGARPTSGESHAAVRIVVEPGDRGRSLTAAIQGAKKSVHVTMYLMTLKTNQIVKALIERAQEGVDVKVILNAKFPNNINANKRVYQALEQAGVNVKWAPAAFEYTHSKCVIIDGNEAWIMTMNAVWSAFEKNREYAAIDSEPADVAEAELIFAADWDDKSSTPQGDLVVSPDNARARIEGLISSAKKTIDVEVESLSDTGIVARLSEAEARGVQVRAVIGQTERPATQQAIAKLKEAGVEVVDATGKEPPIHAKAIVVDNTKAYIGSINMTYTSLTKNRELGVIVTVPSEVAKVATTIARDLQLN